MCQHVSSVRQGLGVLGRTWMSSPSAVRRDLVGALALRYPSEPCHDPPQPFPAECSVAARYRGFQESHGAARRAPNRGAMATFGELLCFPR